MTSRTKSRTGSTAAAATTTTWTLTIDGPGKWSKIVERGGGVVEEDGVSA